MRLAGYQASLRSLFRALEAAKKEWRQKQMRVYRPWVSAPGDFLIVDFGEVGKVVTAAGACTSSDQARSYPAAKHRPPVHDISI